MDLAYYCPDCHKKFTDKKEYRDHVIDKKYCYRCHKKHKTAHALYTHMNKPTKCINKQDMLAEKIKLEKTGKDTDKNTTEVELLKQQIASLKQQNKIFEKQSRLLEKQSNLLEKKVQTYKNTAVNKMEQMFQSGNNDAKSEETNALALKFKDIKGKLFDNRGYTNDAYITMILGNNEDLMLAGEFGNEINLLDALDAVEELDATEKREDHSNLSSGFMSSKFNNSLKYETEDLDIIPEEVSIGDDDFEKIVKSTNKSINNRRMTQNKKIDIDYDVILQNQLKIES